MCFEAIITTRPCSKKFLISRYRTANRVLWILIQELLGITIFFNNQHHLMFFFLVYTNISTNIFTKSITLDTYISKHKRLTSPPYPSLMGKLLFSFLSNIWWGAKIYTVHFIHVHFQFYLYDIAQSHLLKHIQMPKNYP